MAGPIRVLYVGADPALDEAAGLPGQTRDLTLLTADSAEAALEGIAEGDVDCVVSEGDLPDSTGIELLESVRQDYPVLPFVVYDGLDLDADGERAIAADLTDYVSGERPGELAASVSDAVADADADGESIERSQERFRTIIEQSTDVVSILDGEGVYQYQSPSAESVLGYPPGEFLGENAFEYVHPDDRERVKNEFFAAVETPGATTTVEYRFQHEDGSWRVIESRGTNMLEDPVVEGMVINSRDVTERRRREQRVTVLNRTLRHDLRNNMNVILGNAELLMREYGSDDRAETIRRTAADLLELGNKVRDLEQALDSSESPREMVDVVSVVEEALAAVERGNPELEVETDLPDSEWVLANRLIGSAIDDAVQNAIEHNDGPDPRLRVSIEDATLTGEDAVTLEIADNGPGIPDEELDVLLQGGETPLRHASGLGLWLIKWIVNESAGDLEFEDSEMGGTVVRITLQKARVGQRIGME